MTTDHSENINLSRRKRVLDHLKRRSLDAMIVTGHLDIFYLTGFYGRDSNSILVVTPGKVYLLVNFIFYEDAVSSTSGNSIEVVLYRGRRMKKTAEVVSSTQSKKTGLECSRVLYSEYKSLEKELKKYGINISICEDVIGKLRVLKDSNELNTLRQSCRMADRAFEDLLSYGADRISAFSELTLASEMERLCIVNGASGRSFDYVIASGPSSSRPHHSSSHRKISGGVLLMDFGAIYNNYCSDITRTIFTGKKPADKRLREIYKVVLEAQLRALEACREGIRCDELDRVARKYIESRGHGPDFGHGLGHGVGLEVHERPYVTGRDRTVLKEDMVVTIEPGIYIPGLGGVRIEDMVVVRKNGCMNLYSSKKDFTFLS